MQNVYRLREGCSFFPYDGHPGETAFIVKTPDGRQFRISTVVRDILLQLVGETTLDEVARTLKSSSIDISPEDLRLLMKTRYQPLGIVENPDSPAGPAPEAGRKIRLPFLLHWDLIPERYVRWMSRYLAFAFGWPVVLPALCLILVTHYLVYFGYSSAELLSHGGAVPVLVLCLASVLWHEFGHSSAVSRYGGSPGRIGFGLFVLLPSFYADVSEIWRFSRRQRMIVDLAGVYFQQIFFAGVAVLGVLTLRPEYFVVCRFIDLMVLLTLNPVFQLDGYWLLADWLGLPKLYRLALSYIAGSIKRLFVGGANATPLPPMPRHSYVVFVVYAALSNLFLVGVGWMSYRYLSSVFAQMHHAVPSLFASTLFALKTRDLASLVERSLSLFFVVAFPATALVGICRYGVILARYCVRQAPVAGARAGESGSEPAVMLAREAK